MNGNMPGNGTNECLGREANVLQSLKTTSAQRMRKGTATATYL